MKPTFEEAMAEIEEEHRLCIEAIEDVEGSLMFADLLRDNLDGLDRKADVYRYLANPEAAYEAYFAHEQDRLKPEGVGGGDAIIKHLDAHFSDALYVYTRKQAFFEEGDFVLAAGESIIELDAFNVTRFLHFSVARWWREVSGDRSNGLRDLSQTDLIPGNELCPASPHWVNIGVQITDGLEEMVTDGLAIQRWELTLNGFRFQRFGPNPNISLVAVVRQWVEERDTALADWLTKDKRWQALLNDRSSLQRDLPIVVLQKVGLPHAPSVQRHLEQEHNKKFGNFDYLSERFSVPMPPCRGGLVTTFILVSGPSSQDIQLVNKVEPAGEVTGNFWSLAGNCLASHAEWVKTQKLGILKAVTKKGRAPKDDPINRDIAEGLSRNDVINRHLARKLLSKSKKGLPFTDEQKDAARRLASERCRRRKII